jgi:hypothetical protein
MLFVIVIVFVCNCNFKRCNRGEGKKGERRKEKSESKRAGVQGCRYLGLGLNFNAHTHYLRFWHASFNYDVIFK